MRSSLASASFVLLAALPLLSMGCAASGDDEGDSADSSESDVKKKVKPKAGNGAFDLAKPTFTTDGFEGQHVFGGSNVAIGGRVERVPGTYNLSVGGQSLGTNDGRAMAQVTGGYTLGVGTILSQKASGLRVKFAEPLTLGRAYVEITPTSGSAGYLTADGGWRARAEGSRMFVLPGDVRVRSYADTATTKSVTVTEGNLAEVILPIARVKVVGDEYDATYPTTSNCALPSVRVGAQGYEQSFVVRRNDGTVDPTTYVVPQGPQAPAVLDTYGYVTVLPTVAGSTHTFTVNRLEVDDVEVNAAGGGTQIVKGTFTIQRKVGAQLTTLNCNFPTHTGVDLPDGTYVITSTASSASGPVRHVEEVSFP